MLPDAEENHRDPRGVHHTDQGADHVAHGVAFGDDEAVEAGAVVAELALEGGEGRVSRMGYEGKGGKDGGRSGVRGGGRGGGDDDGW